MAEVFSSASGFLLPTEVLEMVMAQLPLADMLTCHALVCHRWSDVICNPAFIPWKKMYHRLKLAPTSLLSSSVLNVLGEDRTGEEKEARTIMKTICSEHNITDLTDCLVGLVRLMGKVHRVPTSIVNNQILARHSLFSLALDSLNNLKESLLPRPLTVWHVVTMIVLLAHNMWEVEQIILLLLYQGSPFTPVQVVEGFYCLATFFLHFRDEYKLQTRYHYLVYYALYLYENRWSTDPADEPGRLREAHKGQQSLLQFATYKPKIQHTHEQMRIINHSLKPHHVVKIVAFAGTGKTTTLLQMCKQRPHQRFLLVVYNKSVAEICSKTFPHNVQVKTAHAMAFANVGRRFSAIKKLDPNINASKVSAFLKEKEGSGNRFRRAALVKETLERYMNSDDSTLTFAHTPEVDKKQQPLEDNFRLQVLLDDAEYLWKEMKRCHPQQEIPISQDGQMKLWQLKKPKILGFDVIMIDEGQDMNAALFDIFLNQECARVIVGDPYQQIYSFRGAINALSVVPATHTYFLTQSFRFGPEIAYVANCALESIMDVHRQTLVGGRKRDAIHSMHGINSQNEDNKKTKMAFLARTNLGIYKKAIDVCSDKCYASKCLTFAGGLQKYGFDTVMDIYKLSQVEAGFGTPETLQIQNKLVAKFKSVKNLSQFAENLDDKELMNKIMMFQYSREKTPTHLRLLKTRCSENPRMADITFTTIHKAKGLEWDWVILLDDLPPINLPYPGANNPADVGDEYNLMYVAITRAKQKLSINSATFLMLTKACEKYERLVSRAGVEGMCLQCGKPVSSNVKLPLITKVLPVSLYDSGEHFIGGHLCDSCSKLSSFLSPETRRYPLQHVYLVCDSSRTARRMLITGGDPQSLRNLDVRQKPKSVYSGRHMYALDQHIHHHL